MSEDKSIIEKVADRREEERKKKEKKQELLEDVSKWEEEGWDVSNLKSKIDENPSKGEKLIEEYEKRIEKLKRMKKLYSSLPLEKYNAEPLASQIEKNLDDPDAVEKVEKKVKRVKRKVREEEKRKELLKKASEWKTEGLRVDELIETLKKDLEQGKKMFKDYKENIEELRLLRKKYSLLERRNRSFDTIEIEHNLNDPTAVEELRDRIEELEDEQVMMEEKDVSGSETQPFEEPAFQGEDRRDTSTTSESTEYFSQESSESEEKEAETVSFESKEDWSEVLEEERRNGHIFRELRNEIKYDEDLEEKVIDHLQTDQELRDNFIYYMQYWNKNVSEESEEKYFKVVEDEKDFKVLKIFTASPILGCLYGLAILLKEGRIGVSKSTHPHLFFREYKDKLFGEAGEEVEMEEKDDIDIYDL